MRVPRHGIAHQPPRAIVPVVVSAMLALLSLASAVAPTLASDGEAGTDDARAERRLFPYPVHAETFDNGFKVVVIPMSSNGLAAYWTVVRTGARDEYEPGRTGFAHFFEHMMFRGTEKYPQDVYGEIVTELGADANAYTTDDLTAYHLSIAAEDLERVMDIESDRFRNLAYPKSAFETEAGAVYGEYRKNRMSALFTIYEAVHKAAFDVHTYGHTAMGYEEDIARMPRMYDYSRSFFSRYYRPENCILVVAGDVEPDATLELAKRYYGDWESGYVPPKVEAEPEQTEERRIDVVYPGRSLPVMWVAYKFDAFDPDDTVYAAADLLADLAFGETSDIYRKLVLEDQVVEFLAADAGFNRDPGLFDIYTRIKDPEEVDEVLAEIDATIERYRKDLPDTRRLEELKSRKRYQFLMNLDTPDAVAGGLARVVAITGGVEAVDTLYRTYERVTPDDVREAARRYLAETRRTVAILRGTP